MFQKLDKARSSGIAARARVIAIACAAVGTAVIVFGFPSLGSAQPEPQPTPPPRGPDTSAMALMDAPGTSQRLAMIKNAPVPPDPPPPVDPTAPGDTPPPADPPKPEMPAKYSGILASGSTRLGILSVDGKQRIAAVGDKISRGEGKPAVELVALEADHAMVKVGDGEPTRVDLAPRSTAGPAAIAAASAPAPTGTGAASASSAESRAERIRAMRNRRSRPTPDAKRGGEEGGSSMEAGKAEETGEK